MRPRPRYHIRWKIILWGMMIIGCSMLLTWAASPFLGRLLTDYIRLTQRGPFIVWLSQGLTSILFFIFALLITIFTSKTMVSRVLELSQAAKEIAKGNFSVRVSEVNRRDEVYQLALDFNRMAEHLQTNEYMRKDFISNVSHEIKTPLSVINGYVQLLEEDPDAPERKEYLAIISRESKRLLHLSQNMLQISQLDNASIHGEQNCFRLDEQLRQVILLLEPRWAEKQLDLDVDLDECSYFADEELLFQVWVNILDNAIKFSPVGGCLSVRLREQEDIKISIRDQGPGMEPATLDRIYEQFYQGDRSRKKEGAGLGMSIVRRIVDLHSGQIIIRSAVGEGTTVTVSLPLQD